MIITFHDILFIPPVWKCMINQSWMQFMVHDIILIAFRYMELLYGKNLLLTLKCCQLLKLCPIIGSIMVKYYLCGSVCNYVNLITVLFVGYSFFSVTILFRYFGNHICKRATGTDGEFRLIGGSDCRNHAITIFVTFNRRIICRGGDSCEHS